MPGHPGHLSKTGLPRSRYLSRHATLIPTSGVERCVTRQITASWETTLRRTSISGWFWPNFTCSSVTYFL